MKPKILIITPGFPKNEEDSTCVPYLQDYLLALSKKIGADQIKVITTQYPFTKTNYYWNNIQIFPSGGANKRSFHYYFTLRRTMKNIAHLLKKEKFIIHVFWLGEAAFLGNRTSTRFNSKLIITLMGQDVKPGNRTIRFINSNNVDYVALSQNQHSIFRNSYDIEIADIIPFPIPEISNIDVDAYRDIDLLFVGSLIEIKNPLQFVQIVRDIKYDFPKIKAVMLGDGYLYEDIKKLIESYNLQDNLKVMGIVERIKVFEMMKNSKILIHTSQFEGQCLVYAEALAHGLYVISYNTGRIESTEKHLICNSESEILINAGKLLRTNLNFTSQIFVSADEVVDKYCTLYYAE